eukprot:TRINITY_DN36045_c0_g1_i1.p1 TRINITY_DN36045_c0_g1~~TRINITY_DN36045_c0_g1_i1.p1  ORF type:complete len:563 (+),score=137.51 TRINITY_DN36045_c0_g1_i1:86-1774(+)
MVAPPSATKPQLVCGSRPAELRLDACDEATHRVGECASADTTPSLSGGRGHRTKAHATLLGIDNAALRDVEIKMKKKVRELALWQKKVAGASRRTAAHSARRQVCMDFMIEIVFRVFQLCTWLSDNFLGWGMLLSTALAYRFPSFGRQGGPLRPEYSVNSVTAALFFLCGLMFRRDKLREALLHFKLNSFVLCYTFLIVPALTYGAMMLGPVSSVFSVELRLGILVTACMPSSSTTTIFLTHAAGGNEGVAVANTTLGLLTGVFVCPALISILLASPQFTEKVRVVRPAVLRLLFGAIILPIIAGQLCQAFLPKGKARSATTLLPLTSRDDDRSEDSSRIGVGRIVGQLSQLLLLVLNYYVFCSAFAHLRPEESAELASGIVPLFGFLLAQQALHMLLCWGILSAAGVEPPARVAALLCCSSKTEGLAIPLVITMFDRTRLGLLPVPIVLQNCAQAILGAVLSTPLRSWLARERTRLSMAGFARLEGAFGSETLTPPKMMDSRDDAGAGRNRWDSLHSLPPPTADDWGTRHGDRHRQGLEFDHGGELSVGAQKRSPSDQGAE